MNIPATAERITFRSANSKRPARVEPSLDFEDGFRPRQTRFGQDDERYTLALASRLQLSAETNQPGFTKVENEGTTTYTGVTQNGQECRAAVARFETESGQVQFSEFKWNLAR
ncbi:hypothetical protein ABS71_17685 [bacterium SCN 62-11]|nr:hypothetical protein [Candidatus Eremiobacteraeota bacterium]ODT59746.1 MAG: hypothetical protein ABS71_17685 [bacterium SCN 62-11]